MRDNEKEKSCLLGFLPPLDVSDFLHLFCASSLPPLPFGRNFRVYTCRLDFLAAFLVHFQRVAYEYPFDSFLAAAAGGNYPEAIVILNYTRIHCNLHSTLLMHKLVVSSNFKRMNLMTGTVGENNKQKTNSLGKLPTLVFYLSKYWPHPPLKKS